MPKKGKHTNPNNNQHIYLDSCILIGAIDKDESNDVKKISEKNIQKIKNSMRRNPYIFVKIPMIIAGEVFLKIMEKYPDNENEYLERLIKKLRDLNADIVAPSIESISIMQKLLQKDNYFQDQPTDLYAISQALSDPYSTHFITIDGNIITHNRSIMDLEKDLREEEGKRRKRLIITDLY